MTDLDTGSTLNKAQDRMTVSTTCRNKVEIKQMCIKSRPVTDERMQDTVPTEMQADPLLKVLIVGAGPTGLTLACELARHGVAFRLIEAAPGPQPGSRGKSVQPRTLEVFEDLGIIDGVIANGRMSMPIHSTGSDGRVTVREAEPLSARPDIPYSTSLITPEWQIEEALRVRLAELGGAVEFGTALGSCTQSDREVSALVVKGGKTETVVTRWLVGCDGGHSIVRRQAGIAFEGETHEEMQMIVADVEVDGLDLDAWHTWSHEEGLVSLCPLPSTNIFQYQAGISPGQDSQLSLANMQATLERRSGNTTIRLHEPEWSSLWRANIRLANRYREGRVLLAGDAAHIHSPAGGQGMNTGIQDAYNLGWKLAAVMKGASLALLDSYEAERRPIAAGMLALSNARLKEVIDEKECIPTRRDTSAMGLGLSYRGSVLARDDRTETASLRAGDRAPDATGLTMLRGEHRLFDLTQGGHFTLLNFGVRPEMELSQIDLWTFHVVPQPEHSNDIVDTDGHLTRSYGATDCTLVLIRPDGYVALISDQGHIADVSAYFAAIA